MNLSNKLYNLYLKIIEKTESRLHINDHFSCELKEDGETYSISIKSTLESFAGGKQIYTIYFQDLISNVSKDQYDVIINTVKDRIKYFEEIEKEKLKKQQEIIVDRLLDKFK